MSRSGKAKSHTLLPDASQSAFICFGTRNIEPRILNRARFDPTRRLEVEKVRKRGACLRCRLLKIPCSGEDDPCASCIKVARATSRALERKVLRWTDCIRTLLTDVKFFDEAIPTEISQVTINTFETVLAETPVTLEFASQMTWEIDSFTSDIFTWLDSGEAANTSKVGSMSSPQFQDLIKPQVGHDVSFTFRLMIYAISLARTQKCSDTKYQLSTPDLQKIGALAGKRCLKYLDNTLTALSLAKIFKDKDSKEKLQALFLLAFGTILAVGYAEPASESPVFTTNKASSEDPRFSQSQTLHKVMQSHLCRTLAHHLVYLSSRLGFPIPSTLEKFILDTAQSMWNKKGHFLWKPRNTERDALREDDGPDEPAGNLNNFDWEATKWPVYSTESHYTGDSHDFHDAGTSTGNYHGAYAATSSQVIESIRIPADLVMSGHSTLDQNLLCHFHTYC